MNENTSTNARRLSFVQILTLIFVVAKLTGYITWSWVWVLAPLWIPLSIALVMMAMVLIFAGIIAVSGGTVSSSSGRVNIQKRW